MKQYYVYIMTNKLKTLYIGVTDIAICKNGYTKVIARLMKSAEAISEVVMRLPRFARNDR